MDLFEKIEKAIFKDRSEEKIKSSVPYKGYPVTDRGKAWDGSGARKRIAQWAGGASKDDINWDKYKEGFAWYDASNKENFGSYKLPHHDVIDGSLKTVFAGVSAAAAAVRGARGGVNISSSDLSAVRSHLAKHYKQFDETPPWNKDKEIVEEVSKLSKSLDSGVKFFKDKNTGWLRWIAAWSSNYLDDDYPPDILSAEAHKNFVENTEKGIIEYPELWHWHIKGTKWGMTDWLAYDEDYGIIWASGIIDEGHEKEALALVKSKTKIGVSHGMKDIVRDPADQKVIAQYITYEISDLPLRWAANKMTALFIAEKNSMEVNMTISNEKKQYLRDAGLPDEEIEELDKFGEEQAEKFSNRARKETEAEEEVKEEPEAEVAEEQEGKDAKLESETAKGETGEETEEPEKVEEQEEQETKDTEEDRISLLKSMLEASFEQFGEGVVKALERIETRILELEKANEKREKREKEKEFEPLSTTILSKLSAIGSKEAELDDDDELKDSKPEEAEVKSNEFGESGNFSEFLAKNLFGN